MKGFARPFLLPMWVLFVYVGSRQNKKSEGPVISRSSAQVLPHGTAHFGGMRRSDWSGRVQWNWQATGVWGVRGSRRPSASFAVGHYS